jgi:Rrf2 family transcriptional regulator, iron-sulfur cluster assembly transcription factor
MIFSKSFGYAVRGVLYIALMQDEKRYVQVEEIAEKLAVPRHFMGKILKNLVKEGVVSSIKGPSGGFTINEQTLQFTLYRIFAITDGLDTFHNCVLRVKECNSSSPCPMHGHMEDIKAKMKAVLIDTTFNDLLSENKDEFIKSISTETDGLGFDEFIFSKEVY